MKSKRNFKLWHLATELPPDDAMIIVMCRHVLYGIRYEVENMPHIDNWAHYIEYRGVIAWCDIIDIHGFGFAEPALSDEVLDELKLSVRECSFLSGKYGGVNYYAAYKARADYLKFLLKLTKGVCMSEEQKITMSELVPAVENLERKVLLRRELVEKKLEKAGSFRSDSKALMGRIEMIDAALEKLEDIKEFLADAGDDV